MKDIHLIAGARPNFMKIAPLFHALVKQSWCRPIIIHTGQHYDSNMSEAFFHDLNLPDPALYLGIRKGTHAEQTGGVMIAYEKACIDHRPDLTVVVGDVNSTMACAITAKKLAIPVVHLEAGLRSRDWHMPEEINRIITDAISDLLLTPSQDADENLKSEGVPQERICLVGNIMIDSYELLRERIRSCTAWKALGVMENSYAVVTLHRPSNVDEKDSLAELCALIVRLAKRIPILFPVHPRTEDRLKQHKLWKEMSIAPGVQMLPPLGYIQFMSLVEKCRLVITDSGGLQEETTYLGKPCLTVRGNTERPITVLQGTNRLVTPQSADQYLSDIFEGHFPKGSKPAFWDGKTAERVVFELQKFLKIDT